MYKKRGMIFRNIWYTPAASVSAKNIFLAIRTREMEDATNYSLSNIAKREKWKQICFIAFSNCYLTTIISSTKAATRKR